MPKAIIVAGSPGAGKSTYARKLAKDSPAVVLDIDTVTERLVRLSLTLQSHDSDDRDSLFFKENYRLPIYETLFDIARENLEIQDVIIVGPFTREIRNNHWKEELQNRLGVVQVDIHYVFCNPDVRRQRIQERAAARDSSKSRDWPHSQLYYGTEEPPQFEHIYVDTSIEVKN